MRMWLPIVHAATFRVTTRARWKTIAVSTLKIQRKFRIHKWNKFIVSLVFGPGSLLSLWDAAIAVQPLGLDSAGRKTLPESILWCQDPVKLNPKLSLKSRESLRVLVKENETVISYCVLGCQPRDGVWRSFRITTDFQMPEVCSPVDNGYFGSELYGIIPCCCPSPGSGLISRHFPMLVWQP